MSGKPANLLNITNPDWFPTLNLGNSKEITENKAKAAEQRWERAKQREVQRSQVKGVACVNIDNVVARTAA